MLIFLLSSMLIIAICVIFISIRIYTCKNGKMKSFHIHDSKEMRERHIKCVIEQDKETRAKAEETKRRLKQFRHKNININNKQQ